MFNKFYNKDGFIIGASAGDISNERSECSEDNFYSLINLLSRKPSKPGYRYFITETELSEGVFSHDYVEVRIPDEKLTDAELKEKYAFEIMNAVEISEKPQIVKKGYHLVSKCDGVHITWEFEKDVVDEEPERIAAGTYLDPIIYILGMAVENSKWYTDGEDIWEAIEDGIPADFSDRKYFDIIG